MKNRSKQSERIDIDRYTQQTDTIEKLRSCRDCIHCSKEVESDEVLHVWWWKCAARPGVPNLRSFPFERTECKKWVSKRKG